MEQIQSTKVSGNFFSVLGTPALFGRTFTASEIARNPNLAVVSYEFWRQRFSLARDVVGRKLEIDGVSFEVIGVMPPVFAFPAKESQAWFPAKDTQMWLPINSDSRWGKFQRIRLADPFGVVARLRENTTNDQAQAEMSEIAGQLAREHPDTDRYLGVHVVPLAIYLVGSRVRLPAADRRGYRFAAEDIASIVQAPVVHVSDYAHYAGRSPMGDRQRLPNRILIGEEPVCERAVNHHHLV